MEMKMNEFVKMKSSMEPYTFVDLDTLANDVKEKYTYAIIWNLDGVEVVYVNDAKITDKLLEVRAFNEEEELHVIKVNQEYRGRIRRDVEEESENEVFDEKHLLWGKVVKVNDKYVQQDERGIHVNFPLEKFCQEMKGTVQFDESNSQKELRLHILIRNYFNSEDATFDDYRCVNFGLERVMKYEANKEGGQK